MRTSLIAVLALCASAVSATSLSFGSTNFCQDLDAVVLVQVDGLDRSTFSGLRHASPSLKRRALEAPAQMTFVGQPDLCGLHDWSETVAAGQDIAASGYGGKGIIKVQVTDLKEQEESLLETLDSISHVYPRNKVLITPASSHLLHKRQYYDETADNGNGNWTEPEGSIFNKYQPFSSPMILILGVVFIILAPITIFTVGQLSSMQIPDQIGVRRDLISGEKKSQ